MLSVQNLNQGCGWQRAVPAVQCHDLQQLAEAHGEATYLHREVTYKPCGQPGEVAPEVNHNNKGGWLRQWFGVSTPLDADALVEWCDHQSIACLRHHVLPQQAQALS